VVIALEQHVAKLLFDTLGNLAQHKELKQKLLSTFDLSKQDVKQDF